MLIPPPTQAAIAPQQSAQLMQKMKLLADEMRLGRMTNFERLELFRGLAGSGCFQSLARLLPILFTHGYSDIERDDVEKRGKRTRAPYTIKHHYHFEPIFRTVGIPETTVFMTARQVAKSTSNGSCSVAKAAALPGYKQLHVLPLFEQARRFSSNVVRPLIDNSPVRSFLTGTAARKSVLERTFRNESMMQFTFALLDPDRARGISCDEINYDEAQNISLDFRPIINQAMSHSKFEISHIYGTPLTPENSLSGDWSHSSQCEWFIPCFNVGCDKHWNIPSLDNDLERMIGPLREDISEKSPGLVCAKCQKPIFPETGRWVPRFPDRHSTFAGYHISQPIVHIHYTSRSKWAKLLGKREGAEGYTPDKFINEVLGEPCGSAAQLITQRELQAACVLPWKNADPPEANLIKQLSNYDIRLLCADWGGGGKRTVRGQMSASLTKLALCGIRSSGQIDVLWGKCLWTPHDALKEATEVAHWYKLFRCHGITHDYTGAGELRDQYLIDTQRIRRSKIYPVRLLRTTSQSLMYRHNPKPGHPRRHYVLDKARSLQRTIGAIKLKKTKFFQWDFQDAHRPGLVSDFLGLVEEKISSRFGGDAYTISRHASLSDDFAQAVNLGCCMLWYMTNKWPTLGSPLRYQISQKFANAADITDENGGWDGGEVDYEDTEMD